MAIEHTSVDLRSLWKAPKYSGGNTSAGHTGLLEAEDKL